jgi:hypothetical protein
LDWPNKLGGCILFDNRNCGMGLNSIGTNCEQMIVIIITGKGDGGIEIDERNIVKGRVPIPSTVNQ